MKKLFLLVGMLFIISYGFAQIYIQPQGNIGTTFNGIRVNSTLIFPILLDTLTHSPKDSVNCFKFAVQDSSIRRWNGIKWVNIIANVSGGSGNATSIQGKAVDATTPTIMQYLRFDGTKWVPTYLTIDDLTNGGFAGGFLYHATSGQWNTMPGFVSSDGVNITDLPFVKQYRSIPTAGFGIPVVVAQRVGIGLTGNDTLVQVVASSRSTYTISGYLNVATPGGITLLVTWVDENSVTQIKQMFWNDGPTSVSRIFNATGGMNPVPLDIMAKDGSLISVTQVTASVLYNSSFTIMRNQ